jgi:Skp family chaperone for outer membrane proteins
MLVAVACAALLTPAMSASAQAGSPCANGNKVALVNAQRILGSIPAYMQAESLLAKEVAGYKADIDKQKNSLDSASNAYSEGATMLNTAGKTAAMRKLQDQNDALQKHAADLESKAGAHQAELLQPIQIRVQEVLDGVRAALSCSIVLDVSPGAQAGIASADKSLDITDRVIELLKGTTATTPAKPPTAGGIKPPGGGGGGGGELPAAALPAKP